VVAYSAALFALCASLCTRSEKPGMTSSHIVGRCTSEFVMGELRYSVVTHPAAFFELCALLCTHSEKPELTSYDVVGKSASMIATTDN